MALIATTEEGGQEIMLGVARYIINPDGESCEFATAVADAWQGRGIGQKLMRMLMEVARDKGLRVMESEVLARNAGMLELAEALGFEILPLAGDEGVRGVRKRL
jgi:acetyltransferase